MIYGEKLKNLREEANIKQLELANLINVSRSLYGRYETGNEIIPIKHLNTVCNYFKVSIDYIFDFNDDMESKKKIKPEIDKTLMGKRLKEFRNKNKLTQKDLASILGTSQSTIAEYERGTNIIATAFLYSICSKYHISADYLLGKTD